MILSSWSESDKDSMLYANLAFDQDLLDEFLTRDPERAIRFYHCYEEDKEGKEPVLGRAFINKYKNDARYNSAAYFIGRNIGMNVERLSNPAPKIKKDNFEDIIKRLDKKG